MSRFLLLLTVALVVRGEVIDRIAVSVGSQVITELQLDEELRVTALVNHAPVVRDLQARREAAGRLIDQLLVKHEMELSHYPLPEAADIDKYFSQVQASYKGQAGLARALAAYDLTETTLREHLGFQLTTLRFIEYRFRPGLGISESNIETYYEHEIATWKTDHPGSPIPSLSGSRDSIRRKLIEERTDAALDAWLKEARKQITIVFIDKSLG